MVRGSKCVSLPLDDLPAAWNDEARVNVLFAPIRSRSANPHDWDSKLIFWKNLIFRSCTHSSVYTFTVNDLYRAFIKDGRAPSCIDVVVEELHKSGELQPLEEFVVRRTPVGWGRWMTDVLVRKPLVWSYGTLKSRLIGHSSSYSDQTYVHLPAIKKNAEGLLAKIPDNFKNKLINLQELLEVINDSTYEGNTDSLKLVLHHLRYEGLISIKELKQTKDYKNAEQIPGLPSENILIKVGDRCAITEMDMSVYMLREKEKHLIENIETLEKELLKIVEEAKAYMKKGHRQLAKNSLRKKHGVENRITQQGNTLNNIQILLSKVLDSHSDADVLQAYKNTLSSIQSDMKDNELFEDAVHDTMDDLKDVLYTSREIESTLSQDIASEGDEDELEKELAEILASDENSGQPKPPPTVQVVDDEDDSYKNLEKRLQKLRMPLHSPEENNKVVDNKIAL